MTKKIGLSIAAAAVLASTNVSAADNLSQAFTNATMNGKATLYYQSIQNDANDQFTKASASGNAALEIGLTTEKYNGVQLDMNYVMLNTLGLENDIVSTTIQQADGGTAVGSATPAGTDTNKDGTQNDAYFGVFSISKDITENNNIKVGYQELATPLLGSDKWQVTPNTFNASVLTNKSVKDLTVTVANVSQERKRTDVGFTDSGTGVWAVGLTYAGIEGTPINFWTYDVNNDYDATANPTGVKGSTANYLDVNTKVAGLAIGLQYGVITPHTDTDNDPTSALGAKVGYKADAFGAMFAFSQVGGDASKGSGDFAKYSDGGNKTPLYTVGVASDGDIVGATDTTSMKLAVDTGAIAKDLNLALHYTTSTHGDKSNAKKIIAGSEEDTSTSTEVIAKYGISANTKLFAMYAIYDHTRGAFIGDNDGTGTDALGDANTFVRVWLRHSF